MISTMSVQIRRRAHVRQIMGMPISIHVRAHDPDRPEVVGAVERAFAHLQRVDRVLSTWRADSDLLRLQHGEIDEPDDWVAEVTDLCLEAEVKFIACQMTGASKAPQPTWNWRPRSPGASAPAATSCAAPVAECVIRIRCGGSGSKTLGKPDASSMWCP